MGLLYPATRSGTNNKCNTITGQAFAYQATTNQLRQTETQTAIVSGEKQRKEEKETEVLGVGKIGRDGEICKETAEGTCTDSCAADHSRFSSQKTEEVFEKLKCSEFSSKAHLHSDII